MTESEIFWDKLYKTTSPKMLGICRRYVLNRTIAEDLMHEAFIVAINKQSSYTGKGSFEGWLRKIVINTALMYLRNENAKKINSDLLQYNEVVQEVDELTYNDIRKTIENANFSSEDLLSVIESLPEHHRLVFNLYVIDNYSHKQISKELNISIGTSKSHLARARKKIQQILYSKAKDLDAKEKKKRKQIMFLFLFVKGNYIDKLYKNEFANFTIDSIKYNEIHNGSINWYITSIPKKQKSKYLLNQKIFFSSIIVGSLIIGIITYLKNINLEKPNNPALTVDSIKTDVSEAFSDSTYSNTKTKVIYVQKKTDRPVVIRKSIIERKTITIRDTVKIKDSIYVE
jgi:RNA polymerase sigma factor (sigma-70 family)